MKLLLPIYCLACLFYAALAFAQQSPAQEPGAEQVPPPNPLTNLGTEYENSIKLLQNRFRIDYEVEELTMVFFRSFGSAPVVLVRPDGSKIFAQDADGENIFWYDAASYDMISIKNPVPGPWQAVGQILPDSRVMVISNIELNVDPLPDVVFSGEIIKQTANLTNAGQMIRDAQFRDVVQLNIDFQSTNNPNENNFGATTQTVAVFEDNGLGMDERPLDGVFTGQFNLTVPHGEWRPIFYVNTPMFSREQVGENLLLKPNPIEMSVELGGEGDDFHKLMIDADREWVDMNSILIDGKVRFPNLDEISFSLTELSPDPRTYNIVKFEFGIHRVKLTAYGKTVTGRDFILDVPEYSFLVEPPPPEPVEEPVALEDDLENMVMDDPALATDMPEEPMQEESLSGGMIALIIGVNVGLLIIGAGGIWWVLRDKKPKADKAEETSTAGKEKVDAPEVEIPDNTPAEDDDPGIVDLSMPEE